ncbi:MAG: hypothetical protein L0211_21285, partial [Planctomycetaceae bacterium]|nr:hypothetical protein [Planctomycetaceae bacterium]
ADQPQGKWTLRHANGQKVAEGYVVRGARSGVWQMWNEEGVLQSEATYRSLPRDLHDLLNADGSLPDPVWGMSGVWTASMLRRQEAINKLHWNGTPQNDDTQRHGQCRAWHANGQLQCEGSYRDDRRDGLWAWYDERGNIVERGTYRANVREGEWTENSQSVTYVAGQQQPVHEQLMIEVKADLMSPSIRRQVAAATRLEELGPACVPLLVELLAQKSDVARLLALRALVRQNAVPAVLLPQIEPLIYHPDSRLSLRAMLAVYQLRPERREALIERIVAAARKARTSETLVEATTIVYRVDPERRQLAVNTLVDHLAGERVLLDAFGEAVFDEAAVEAVRRLGEDALPHLAAAFDSPRADVRRFVLVASGAIIRRGPGEHVVLPNNNYEVRWPIPPTLEQMLIRAKTDPEPTVRAAAEQVGRQPEYGSHMSGGFSGCNFVY